VSYDLTVWTVDPHGGPPKLSDPQRWTPAEGGWSRGGKGWVVIVGASQEVLAEDVPPDVNASLPGIRFLTELSLEPIHAPRAGMTLLRKVAGSVARQARGVVFDPQEDTIEVSSGVKRFAAVPREERTALLSFSWWFTQDALMRREGIERLVRALESEVPETLPRRYGDHEPPQFEYEKAGRDHLLGYLEQNAEQLVVWYPRRPIVHVHRSVRSPAQWQRLGKGDQFRCHYLTIDVEQAALAEPGWPTALTRLWRRVSRELLPFYGEVRTLRGYRSAGGRVGSDGDTERNPTRAWWWKGIPPRAGHAFVVGPPYVELWPAIDERAVHDEALRFVETTNWARDENAADLVGGVPSPLAAVEQPMLAPFTWPEPVYPPVFPFPRDGSLR
jgi:hypothetical protein